MGGFFNYDNPVWRFVGRIWDLFILNLLWVICSIPIITFGAATTAMYYCTLKVAKDRDSGGMFRMFFHSFKDNIKQSTLIWIVMAVTGGILFFDIRFFSIYAPIQNTFIRMIIFTVTCFLMLLWLFIFLYVFPIQAKFVYVNQASNKNCNNTFRKYCYTCSCILSDNEIARSNVHACADTGFGNIIVSGKPVQYGF